MQISRTIQLEQEMLAVSTPSRVQLGDIHGFELSEKQGTPHSSN